MDTRELLKSTAWKICSSEDLVKKIYKNKRLPLKKDRPLKLWMTPFKLPTTTTSQGKGIMLLSSPLAAPENFILGEDDLRASISKQLLQLEVDTYLKITVRGLDKVEEAKRKAIPLNALLLGELWTNSTLGACVLQK